MGVDMANEVLEKIADDVRAMQSSIDNASELVTALREAGEEVGTLERELHDLELRRGRWVRMLQAHGLEV